MIKKIWLKQIKLGRFSLEKPYPARIKYLYYICAGVFTFEALYSVLYRSLVLSLFCFLGAAFCFLWGFNDQKVFESLKAELLEKEKAKQEEYDRQNPYRKQEQFFLHCRDRGITDISHLADFERVKLLAQPFAEYDSDEKVRNAFLIGKQSVEEKEAKKNEEEKLKTIKAEEQEIYQKNKKYYGLKGREKSLAYCSEQIKLCTEELKKLDKHKDNLHEWGRTSYALGKEKEGNWAVLGGLASGIAGSAAGLATALDVQSKNAEVRERNESFAQDIVSFQASILKDIYKRKIETEKELNEWKENAERAKMLLVDNRPTEKLLNELNPTVKRIWFSETGAIHMLVETEKVRLQIFENVKAIIDGDFKAIVFDGEEKLAEICFTLPFEGSSFIRTLESVSVDVSSSFKDNNDHVDRSNGNDLFANIKPVLGFSNDKSVDDYTIRFETDNLFAIEAL